MDMRNWGATAGTLVQVVVSEAENGLNKEKCNKNCAEYSVGSTNILVKL